MAEEENAAGRIGAAGAEAEFEDVSPEPLAVTLDASAEGEGVGGCEVHAGIDGGLVVGGGFRTDEPGGKGEQVGLHTARAGEQGAHGN
jgi:hypothetical protein